MGIKKKHVPGCGCCEDCGCDGALPTSWTLQVIGLTDWLCTTCDYNATYELTKSGVCEWSYSMTGLCGGTDVFTLTITPSGVSAFTLSLVLSINSGAGSILWGATFQRSTDNCYLDYGEHTLVWGSDIGNRCSGFFSNCKITGNA